MRVLVECYHDWALARALGVPMRRIGHEHGKGNVLRLLAKWEGEAIGLVDADPGKQDSNPGEMAKYRPQTTEHGLTLMKNHADERKTLIVIAPVMEDWLLARAGVSGLRLRDYSLPESARELHKSPRYDRKPGFHRLLADMLAKDDGMKTIKKWLAV